MSPIELSSLESLVNDAFERRNALAQNEVDTQLAPALQQVLDRLESGELRVA